MTLKHWVDNSWLRPHQSSTQEIAGLLGIVERDLKDTRSDVSADWRFGIAYNAALKLCTVVLHASGYRAETTLQHYRTIAAMPLILGDQYAADVLFLEACRKKRNTVEYDMAGAATHDDADELVEFVENLRQRVLDWMKENHPDLLT